MRITKKITEVKCSDLLSNYLQRSVWRICMWMLGLQGSKDLRQVCLAYFNLYLLQSGSETSCAKGIIYRNKIWKNKIK